MFMNQAVKNLQPLRDPLPLADSPLLHTRIVTLGGGTGLSTLLRGLRSICFPAGQREFLAALRDRLTAVVTVADDGGSSGVLRQAYPILAPGDIRNCLLALAGEESVLPALFNFRFNGGVDGHSLGNLILTALAELESDFTRAVEKAGEILKVCGCVLPATVDNVAIQAEFADGSRVLGESKISAARRRIHRVSLVPPDSRALPQAVDAIAQADLVVIGPGSLYTSLLPTLLVPGIAEAIAASRARVVLVMNLMTEPGETDGYGPKDFLRAIRLHTPRLPLHFLLINNAPIPVQVAERYAAEGAKPISADYRRVARLGCLPVLCDLLGSGAQIRHDPEKLARAVLQLAGTSGPQ